MFQSVVPSANPANRGQHAFLGTEHDSWTAGKLGSHSALSKCPLHIQLSSNRFSLSVSSQLPGRLTAGGWHFLY